MIIVCLIIGLIGCIVGGFLLAKAEDSYRNTKAKCLGFGVPLLAIGVIAAFVFLIGGMYCACTINPTIEAEITMYQEENTIIEEKMAMLVENYMLHEKEIMFEVSPDDSITLISMYPELTSQSLVSELLDTYTNNSDKIKELKTIALKQPIVRWWLYFGK
jgi:hypothetical protein